MPLDGLTALIGGAVGASLKTAFAKGIGGPLLARAAAIGSREVGKLSHDWRLPENHDAQLALRKAHFEALRNMVADFRSWADRDPQTALDDEERRFLVAARAYAIEGMSNSKPEKGLDDRMLRDAAKLIDKALAGKLGIDERADALRGIVEKSVLADLDRTTRRQAKCKTPLRFRAAFNGEFEHVEGWHTRYVAFVAQALKDKPAYRDIFMVEKLCAILDGIEGIERGMSGMETRLLAAIAREKGVDPKRLEPLFKAVKRDVPTDHTDKLDTAIREAVDELLSRSQQKPQAFNDPEEIRRAIEVARDKLSRLDTDGAIEHLRRARAEQADIRNRRAQGEARLAIEEADILKLSYRFTEAIDAYRASAELDANDARAWFEIGDIHVHRGNLGVALDAYQHGQRTAKRSGDERDLLISFNRIGDVELKLGNGSAALATFRHGLGIAEKLAARDPANTECQRDLCVSNIKIGDMELKLGNGDAALVAFRQGLTITERLAARDPTNTKWQRDLFVSLRRMGDLELRIGNGEAALTAFRKGFEIAKWLAARDRTNAEWQRDLSTSYVTVGEFELRAGKAAVALAAFRTSYEMLDALTNRDPANTDWQRDLAVCLNKIGDAELRLGNADAALAAFRKTLEIAQQLIGRDSDNTEWQRDVSVSYNKIGDVELRLGNREAALVAFREAVATRKKLADLDSANAEWQRDLAISYDRIGDVERRLGNADAALEAFGQGLDIAKRLAARDPANADWQHDLSASYNKIGDLEFRLGQFGSALTAFRESFVIAARLTTRDAANTHWQRGLSVCRVRIGDAELKLGNGDAALAAFHEGLRIVERLSALDPSNVDWQRDVATNLERIGDSEYRLGKGDFGLSASRNSLSVREELAARDPNNTELQRDLIVSNVKLAEIGDDAKKRLSAALAIAERLNRENRLAPTDVWMVEDLRDRLRQTGG